MRESEAGFERGPFPEASCFGNDISESPRLSITRRGLSWERRCVALRDRDCHAKITTVALRPSAPAIDLPYSISQNTLYREQEDDTSLPAHRCIRSFSSQKLVLSILGFERN